MIIDTKIITGGIYIDGEEVATFQTVTCQEKHDREKYTKCMNCKEKELCTKILENREAKK